MAECCKSHNNCVTLGLVWMMADTPRFYSRHHVTAARVSIKRRRSQTPVVSTLQHPSRQTRARALLTDAYGGCTVLFGSVPFPRLRAHDRLSSERHLSDVCPRRGLQVFPVRRLVRPLVVIPLDEPRYGVLLRFGAERPAHASVVGSCAIPPNKSARSQQWETKNRPSDLNKACLAAKSSLIRTVQTDHEIQADAQDSQD